MGSVSFNSLCLSRVSSSASAFNEVLEEQHHRGNEPTRTKEKGKTEVAESGGWRWGYIRERKGGCKCNLMGLHGSIFEKNLFPFLIFLRGVGWAQLKDTSNLPTPFQNRL
ncbi:hypothetical protein L1887_10095 [Cichorium endivia]|nr:hypothetical protein L1887_10095 [Cichorium endivia]